MAITTTFNILTTEAQFGANTFTAGNQLLPDVLGLDNGGWVTAYNNAGNFILLNFYDANSDPVGGFRIPYDNAGDTEAIGKPSLTKLANGNVLVVWDNDGPVAGEQELQGRIFTPTGGTVGGELALSGSSLSFLDPVVSALPTGGFVISFTFGGNVFVGRYNDAGGQLGGFTQVNTVAQAGVQNDAHVTALNDGGFVVTYTDTNPASQPLRATIYNGDGTVRTADFLIDSFGDNTESAVTALPNGNWAVVYTDSGWLEGGTLGNGITLRIYNANGGSVTGFIKVNSTSTADEREPDITVLQNGYIAVSWTRPFSATVDDIYARIFDQNGNALPGQATEFAIAADGGDVDRHSAIADLFGGEFVTVWQDSDTLDGSGGRITAEVNELTRTAIGDGTNDVFVGDALRDLAFGNDGNDTLNGGANDDVLNGNFGDDTLIGGTGIDTMNGGFGNDLFYVDTTADVIIETAGQGSADKVASSVSYALAGGVEVEFMQTTGVGGTNSINLYGNEFVQSITGNAGDNILNGKGGADTMRGLAGNDSYYVDDAGDVIIEVAGQGTDDRVIASASYALKNNGVNIERMQTTSSAGTDAINLTGNNLVQVLVGNAGNNVLDGKGGADTMNGGDGNDTYYVDNAADTVIEGAGKGFDKIVASTTYALSASAEIEQMQTIGIGATNALNLTGNDVVQTLIGNAGNNRLDGKGGADTMNGSFGDDTYVVDDAGDVVIEAAGRGTDKVIASVSYALSANSEVETMQTNGAALASAINLTGSSTDQTILGNNGANRLDGKYGEDTLRGFGGPDTFVFSTKLTSANVDTILDFNVAQDVMELESDIFTALTEGAFISKAQFAANTSGLATTADHRIIYETDTGNLYYDADGNGGGGRKQFGIVSDNLALTNDDFFVG